MNLDNWKDREKFVWNLCSQVQSLLGSMTARPYPDTLDIYCVASINRDLYGLYYLVNVEYNFGKALSEMFKMKTSDDDEKLIFPLQKAFNEFITASVLDDGRVGLLDSMENLAFYLRGLQLNDYQAQKNLQDEVLQKLEILRDWYKEHYELND